MKTDLTPLLSMQLNASYREDVFTFEPIRNSQSWFGTATFDFAPDAVVTGTVVAAYRDMNFGDPNIKPFRGFVGSATLTYSFLEVGRLSGALSRGVEYSFDTAEAYYVEQSATLAYTHRLFGERRRTGRRHTCVVRLRRARDPACPYRHSATLSGGASGIISPIGLASP